MTTREFEAGTEITGLDTERILAALAAHDVRYILIGGLAAIVHGSTLATADADLLPDPEADNLERLLDALESLDAKVLTTPQRLEMEAGELWEVAELRRGADGLGSAEAWHFTTDAGPIDIVMSAAAVGPHSAHLPNAEARHVFGVRILVAGLSDLIASKQALGRPKDQAVIKDLEDLDPEP